MIKRLFLLNLLSGIIFTCLALGKGDTTRYYFVAPMYDVPETKPLVMTSGELKQMTQALNIKKEEALKILAACSLPNFPSYYAKDKEIDLSFTFSSEVKRYVMYQVYTFRSEQLGANGTYAKDYSILYISNKENQHLDPAMIAATGDGFYMCIASRNITRQANPLVSYTAEKEKYIAPSSVKINWKNKKRVYFQHVNQYISSLHIGSPSDSIKVKNEMQLSKEELSTVYNYANHKNFPEALREGVLKHFEDKSFLKYVGYEVYVYLPKNFTFSYTLVYFPHEENKHMTTDMQPPKDGFYMLLQTNQLAVVPDKNSFLTDTDAGIVQKGGGYGSWKNAKNPSVYFHLLKDVRYTLNVKNENNAQRIKDRFNLNDDELAKLIASSTINHFPPALDDPKKIEASYEKQLWDHYKGYTIYYFSDSVEDAYNYLVYFPAAENRHMPAELQPKTDEGFYISVSIGNLSGTPITPAEKQARYEKSPEYKAKLIAEQEEKDKQDKEVLARRVSKPSLDATCDKCDGKGHYTDYCDVCKNERTIPMFNPEWSTEKAYSAYGKWTNTNCPVCMKGCYTSSQILARKKSFHHTCDKCNGTGMAGGVRKW